MKNLLLTLLLFPLVALAQEPEQAPEIIQVPPEVMEQLQYQAAMQEYTYATVNHFICVVIYERADDQDGVDVYMKAPGVHAQEHGYPITVQFGQFLSATLQMIRDEFDETIVANGKLEELTTKCAENLETTRVYITPQVEQAPVIEGQTI